MAKVQFMVCVEEETVTTLREMATRRGYITKTGVGAPLQRGNASQLLNELAHEWRKQLGATGKVDEGG